MCKNCSVHLQSALQNREVLNCVSQAHLPSTLSENLFQQWLLLLALVQSILPAWVPVSPSPRSWWRLGWSGPRWGWPAPPAAWSQTGCWTPWGQSWRSGGEVMRERRDETKDEGQFGWWFKKCLNNRRQTVPRLPLSQSAALEKSVKHLMTFN